jgi:histidinol-phosphatase (PHP family)
MPIRYSFGYGGYKACHGEKAYKRSIRPSQPPLDATRRVDYHLHSQFSADGHATLPQIGARAAARGITEIGITDHLDCEPADVGYGFFDYAAYSYALESSRGEWGRRLTIRKGVEVDYQTAHEDAIRRALTAMQFDFVIGSVHYVDHQLITPRLIAEKGLRWLYPRYLREVTNSLHCELFHVVGHYDLVQKYLPPSRAHVFRAEREAVLNAIVDADLYLEINTRQLNGTYRDTIPRWGLIDQYITRGGRRFSVGSDAHFLRDVGLGVTEALANLTTRNEDDLTVLFEAGPLQT